MPYSPLLWMQQQRRLLELEYEYEKEQFRKQTATSGIMNKIRRGLCWYPLRTGRSYYNSLNQLVVEVERTEYTETEHGFEPGKPVCFFMQDASGEVQRHAQGGMLKYMNFTGTVSFVDGDTMVIALPDMRALAALNDAGRLGVQLYLDETTYRLMFEAVDKVMNAKQGRIAELRDLFHGSSPAATYSIPPVRFPWLNATQEKAVNEVLRSKDVMIVHGPPGTGKTTTLVEAVYETLRRENQVLVCAQSNMAVDWIAEKLTDRGVPVLRIGNPSRVDDKMLSFTYERRFESHPSYPQLWAIRKTIRDLYAHRNGHDDRDAFHQKIARLKDRATELELAINEYLFNEARVVACTLAGSASRILTGRKFSTLFIDEAAQALEAACWIAIRKADRVILAGDHCQLPPTIKCPEALKGGLDRTLMESIALNKPACVSLLRTQYRMNEQIMKFPSDYFYEGKVESAPEVRYRGILDWDTPMEWIDTADPSQTAPFHTDEGEPEDVGNDPLPEIPDFGEVQRADSTTRTNPEEARLSLNILKNYFRKIGKDRILEGRIDTGVISPYRGQVQLMRSMMRRDRFFKPFRHLISIDTVDGFQGQERDIIMVSMVRSNEEGQIGFLRDLRRMNVAITRARMKLILVGDSHTLCRMSFYKKLYDYVARLDG